MDIMTQFIVGGVALVGLLASFFIKSTIDRKRGQADAKNKIEKAQREEEERQSKDFTESLENSRRKSDESARNELRGNTIKGDD